MRPSPHLSFESLAPSLHCGPWFYGFIFPVGWLRSQSRARASMLLTHRKAPPARANQLAYHGLATAVACGILSRPLTLIASYGAALVARGALSWWPLSHRLTCLGAQGRYGCSCRVGSFVLRVAESAMVAALRRCRVWLRKRTRCCSGCHRGGVRVGGRVGCMRVRW